MPAASTACAAASRLTPDDLRPDLRIDLELPFVEATLPLTDALAGCEPHGIGNPGPVFLARGVRSVAPPKRVGDSGVRLRLSHDGALLDGIAWDFAHRVASVDWSAPMDVAYRLERDEWQGRVRLQARVADIRQ